MINKKKTIETVKQTDITNLLFTIIKGLIGIKLMELLIQLVSLLI